MTFTPPHFKEVGNIIDSRLAALKELKDVQETVTIEWRGVQLPIPVISLPVELAVYNPDTHRLRAQLSVDPARQKELKANPWGDSAQSYLHTLLMGEPANPSKVDASFEALKADLQKFGQNEPGIISRTGILINGNTRRAALKELGVADIRVGVLPPDAGLTDFQSIELSLQLRKDHKRDYSFMNFLLAIDEHVTLNRPAAAIQKDFRIKSTVFDRSRWILQFILDAIERSQITLGTGETVGLTLLDFETHQGKLEELYRAYTALKPASPEEAEMLREQRLLAIALEKSKTDLRLIESDFNKTFLKLSLKSSPVVAKKIPGTNITVPGPNPEVSALHDFTTDILRAKAISTADSRATPAEIEKATSKIAELTQSMDKALDHAGRRGRIVKRRLAAAERLSDACEDIDFAVGCIAEARAASSFNVEDLDEALLVLKEKLSKLYAMTARGTDSEDSSVPEGVAWLRAAATADIKRS
ncbi:Chromosome segregation protein Spo0J, contains ParB-like nuclease domain [Burkholderia sp. YR290]|nr:Chromosome segregation protein Spo0J, contains ParB-like nuclease domain [Burkholderia sp. YR290]